MSADTSILDLVGLNEPQLRAARAPGRLVVTAGAGSGKTRTLVGRYLWLLETNLPLRGIVAITFTDKAAREMRNRIRQAIMEWLAGDPPRRAYWQQAYAELDAARVGTIHSLCAQILRAHPVEAARTGVMPGFHLLEEGQAAMLRARAVEEALAWAAADESASHLFQVLTESGLRTALSTLLDKRLDAGPVFERLGSDPLQAWADALSAWLEEQLDSPQWQGLMGDLSRLRANDPDDKLEIARQAVLAHAGALDAARARRAFDAVLSELAALRAATGLVGSKKNWPGDTLAEAKDVMRGVRDYFDSHLAPLATPDRPASWALDERLAGSLWSLHAAYRRVLDAYAQARQSQNALDFDDLEAGALALLRDASVRAAWQAATQAVLVDEFQDTNERQRQIVYALTHFRDREGDGPRARQAPTVGGISLGGQASLDQMLAPSGSSSLGAAQTAKVPVALRATGTPTASLFVVGDSKQSIYRFRQADVTVFRRVQDDVQRAGGQVIPLEMTFRAHRALVETTNNLLAPILGLDERPGRPYEVPFAPLTACRDEPREGIAPPFVELLLGLGETAAQGRQAAAAGLAARLLELNRQQGVEWGDVALLFRASTCFPVYEDALEAAAIPFVTVAGRGFYERPEVRDLLNALVALADPSDDLALVGLLRSPLVGLSDAALYLLRFPPTTVIPREPHQPCSVWPLLHHPRLADIVPPDDLERAEAGRQLVGELHELAERVPVAVLLKHWLDRTCYRAALGSVAGARAQRNVDKLLADAHTSRLVGVREFVEYVRTLRDVGARESEAPTEAGNAAQLMTVHKAKGLEFPLTVIADAAHSGHGGSPDLLLDEQLGLTLRVRDAGGSWPAAYRLAAARDAERAEAEDRRLLYVAATRAQEKLLVSAHTRLLKGGGLKMDGWLGRLAEVTGLDQLVVAGAPLEAQSLHVADDVACVLYPSPGEKSESAKGQETADYELASPSPASPSPAPDLLPPLLAPPAAGADPKLAEREAEPPPRVWRVVPATKRPAAPAWVVGTLVHAALRAYTWPFAGEGLEACLRPVALELGVVDEQALEAAVYEARRLLRRFREHPLWEELNAAQRWHELPFSIVQDGQPHNGIIDLVYRASGSGTPFPNGAYTILEFKTDRLPSADNIAGHVCQKGYDTQVRCYVQALRSQLGVDPQALLVFLNVGERIETLKV